MQLLEASLGSTSLGTYCGPWQLYRQFYTDKLQLQGPIFPILTEHKFQVRKKQQQQQKQKKSL